MKNVNNKIVHERKNAYQFFKIHKLFNCFLEPRLLMQGKLIPVAYTLRTY